MEEMVDAAAEGVVSSERGKKGHFHQHDDGFASFRSRGTLRALLFRVSAGIPPPLTGAKRFKMVRPPHNSRYCLLTVETVNRVAMKTDFMKNQNPVRTNPWSKELDDLREKGLYRVVTAVTGPPGRKLLVDGLEVINFSGT